MEEINYAKRDSKKQLPDRRIIGKKFLHSGNRKLYVVTGYVWHGDTDEWHVKYRPYNFNEDGEYPEFTRTIENHIGNRKDKPRFILVEDLSIGPVV